MNTKAEIEGSLSAKAGLGAHLLRLKWPVFSAVVIFFAVYWLDRWAGIHGLRRQALLMDNFLLAGLTFVLVLVQQVRHERRLKRQMEIMAIIADVNHHTRNALQVIVGRSVQSIADANAIQDIREAVKRIDWCLREVLPAADERSPQKPVSGQSAPAPLGRSRKQSS